MTVPVEICGAPAEGPASGPDVATLGPAAESAKMSELLTYLIKDCAKSSDTGIDFNEKISRITNTEATSQHHPMSFLTPEKQFTHKALISKPLYCKST